MNALIGGVKIFPVVSFTVWYKPSDTEIIADNGNYELFSHSTDAHLIDGDGDLLLIYSLAQLRIIRADQVTRIVKDHVAIGEEINAQEIQEYDQYWADR